MKGLQGLKMGAGDGTGQKPQQIQRNGRRIHPPHGIFACKITGIMTARDDAKTRSGIADGASFRRG
jgi:hypothetical protein